MSSRSNNITRWARWLATFVGFPAAGVTARLCVGDIDDLAAAARGGLAGGAVLGLVQAFVGGIAREQRMRWAVATACGLSLGLAAGAALVDYATDAAGLALMGAVCGAFVGVAQALATPIATRDRKTWAVATPALWALGWLVTSQVIVDADRHHAVFGSSGALLVSAISGVLVVARRTGESRIPASIVSPVAGVR